MLPVGLVTLGCCRPSEKEIIKQAIYVKLKDVMMRVDLESITSKEVCL